MQETENKIKDLIKELRTISIVSDRKVDQVFSGNYRSAFRGRGIEFSEVRPYIEGDDPRTIDWNVTARMGEPFVKVFQETRELSLILMIDTSSSMNFGSTGKTKKEIAHLLSGIICFSSLKSNDKIGSVFFDSKVRDFLPPRKGKAHTLRILHEMINQKISYSETDYNSIFDFIILSQKRKSVLFLISDFIDFEFNEKIKFIAKKHDLVLIRIRDTFEESPQPGMYDFFSSENGNFSRVFISKKKAKIFEENRQKEREDFVNFSKKNGIDFINLSTQDDVFKKLLSLFKLREKRRKRF